MKTSACRDGTLKHWPNRMGTTLQHLHTIPTSCAILPTMHNTKLSTLNEHGTQHYSKAFHIKGNPYLPHSAAIKFHNIKLKLPTYPTGPALLTVSAYHSFYIPTMLSSNYIASTHNISHSPCISTCMHYHTQQYLPNCIPQSSYAQY